MQARVAASRLPAPGRGTIVPERRPGRSPRTSDTEAVEAALRRNQRSPEEVARLAAGRRPFSYAGWQRKARPATPEELADREEFLRQRDAERA